MAVEEHVVYDFDHVSRPVRVDADRFEAWIPDGWQQGRGAFGGLVLAHLARAIEGSRASAEQPLRALTAELCGPVPPGTHPIKIERLRAGTGVCTIAASIAQGEEVLAHAVGVLGRRRMDGSDFCDKAPCPAPPWRDVEPLPASPVSQVRFAQAFEFRITGPLPFSGASEAVAAGWVRARDPGKALDAGYVIALADAWWPAVYSRFTAPRPMATVAFTLELVGSLDGLDPAAPMLHVGRAVVAQGGYVVEFRELWGEDGRLVALNQQTLAIIK